MRKLQTYMKRYWVLYLFGFVCMLVSIGLDMLSPQITKRIVDDVIVGGRMELLAKLLTGILGIGLGRAVFQYGKEFTYDYIGVTLGHDMRRDLFGHIQKMSMDFFDRHNTGELMTRVKDDVDKVWVALGFIGILSLEALIHTVMVVFCMFRLNSWLTLVPLAVLPVIGFCAIRLERGLGSVYEDLSEETAKINTVAQECFAGVRTVKAFAREEYEIEKFSRHNRRFYELNMNQVKLVSKYQSLITFLGKAMLLAVIVVGGLMVILEKMTMGDLMAFSEYANNVIWPMEILGWLSNDIASAFASWKKIKKVAAEKAVLEVQEDRTDSPLETCGEICFDHVGFTLDGHEILKDVCFTLHPGQTLGIMGMTGSGKTMLVNLLQRFYDVTEGRILLDGRDIRTWPLDQLRASMAVVMQDVFLFSDTVAENVKTGKRDSLSQEMVEWAAQKAGAGRFISRLGSQYDTIVGERGVGLSGGQKQRLCIARALAKQPKILVLDDATSALDLETERMIQNNLKEAGNASKIIIGHRISAVQDADEILILEAGRIAERGNDRTLMAKKGRYYETWRVQYACAPDEGEVEICPSIQ